MTGRPWRGFVAEYPTLAGLWLVLVGVQVLVTLVLHLTFGVPPLVAAVALVGVVCIWTGWILASVESRADDADSTNGKAG